MYLEISGKNKKRKITAPSQPIKLRQQWILSEILEKNKVSNNCHGFVRNRSILTNAKKHIGHKNILNIDIKDFFPSITQNMVVKEFLKWDMRIAQQKHLQKFVVLKIDYRKELQRAHICLT